MKRPRIDSVESIYTTLGLNVNLFPVTILKVSVNFHILQNPFVSLRKDVGLIALRIGLPRRVELVSDGSL